jgi:UDP-N-acetylenolpyruvoylglucosamine reductase
MKTALTELKTILGPTVKEQESLAAYTTFKIGGPADLFFEAKTTDDVVRAVTAARKLEIPVWMLGGGTNILIGDKGIRGLVVKNVTSSIKVRGMKGQFGPTATAKQVFVEVDAGVILNKLVRTTVEEGLAGLEMHLGLPGTVGGAIYMNSKWTHPHGYVGDVVYQAELLSADNTRKTVTRDYFQFAYDTSILQKTQEVLLSVVFALTTSTKEELWKIANDSIAYRRQSQPQGIKSAGCTFQNVPQVEILSRGLDPKATSAGFLVDHAGLKGLTIGNAQISPLHANFIVNLGGATASDVVQLIDRAHDQVKRQFGITLTEEIVRVGEF